MTNDQGNVTYIHPERIARIMDDRDMAEAIQFEPEQHESSNYNTIMLFLVCIPWFVLGLIMVAA